jgi:uncharacterized membrane protein
VFVHFPLALWMAAILWDLVGWWQADPLWWRMGYWCLALGLAVSLPALITGLLDYLALRADEPGLNVATAHMMVMMSATTAFGASWLIRAQAGSAFAPSAWAFALALVGAALLAVGGWLGGTLVYHHGIGRINAGDMRR